MQKIGFIIAAGKQTRFGIEKPKALMEYKGETIVNRSMRLMRKHGCEYVFVVTSKENDSFFKDAGIKDSDRIVIESGYGCGDAVWKAVKEAVGIRMVFDACICWGDTILDEQALEKVHLTSKCIGVVPVVEEDKQYVSLTQDTIDTISVKFSKFGEDTTNGYHDLSIFMATSDDIIEAGKKFREKYWDGEKYVHPHGNEFEFLDLYNEGLLKGKIALLDRNAKALSFNTIEEFKNL